MVAAAKVIPEKFYTEYASVLVYGEALEITDAEQKKNALLLLVNKYSKDADKGLKHINARINKTCVFNVHIEYMSGKCGK